jgi:O-antigen/teichoic acid export membrane protein
MSLGARVGRAILWGQAGRVAEASLFFVFSLLLARVLGPASYGLYALGMGLAGVCAFLTLLGLGPETLGRFLPELIAGGGRNCAGGLLKKLLAIRSAAILLLAAIIFSFRGAIGERLHFPLFSGSLALVLLLFASRSILDLLTHFSSGLLELRRVAAAKLAASLAAPCIFLAFWLRHAATTHVAWLATIVGAIAGILVLAVPFLAMRSAWPGETTVPARRILVFGMFAWVTNFFVFVLGDNTDVLLLGWLVADRAAIGHYAVGAKIVFSLTGMLLGWVTLSSVATLSEAWQKGGLARLATLVEAQWKFGVLCMVGPYLLVARFAREIIMIFYSSAFGPSVPVIQILSVLMTCGVICGFSMQAGVLYALNHERLACAAVGAAAIFNVASEIFLVRFLGINGAAWATGLSFVLLAILCAAAGVFYVPMQIPLPFIGKVIAASILSAVSTLWMHPASVRMLVGGCVLYGAVFLTSLAVMKPLSGKDSVSLHRVNGILGGWVQKLFVDMNATVEEG